MGAMELAYRGVMQRLKKVSSMVVKVVSEKGGLRVRVLVDARDQKGDENNG